MLSSLLFPLLFAGGLPPYWYDPSTDPGLGYDRVACQEQTRIIEGCELTPANREASQESYFEVPRNERTSWWLETLSRVTPSTPRFDQQ